jgi:hypothetical protein
MLYHASLMVKHQIEVKDGQLGFLLTRSFSFKSLLLLVR